MCVHQETQELSTELGKANEQVTTLESHLDESRAAVAEAQAHVRRLQEEVAQLQAAKVGIADQGTAPQLEEAESALAASTEQVQQLQEELAKLTTEKDGATTTGASAAEVAVADATATGESHVVPGVEELEKGIAGPASAAETAAADAAAAGENPGVPGAGVAAGQNAVEGGGPDHSQEARELAEAKTTIEALAVELAAARAKLEQLPASLSASHEPGRGEAERQVRQLQAELHVARAAEAAAVERAAALESAATAPLPSAAASMDATDIEERLRVATHLAEMRKQEIQKWVHEVESLTAMNVELKVCEIAINSPPIFPSPRSRAGPPFSCRSVRRLGTSRVAMTVYSWLDCASAHCCIHRGGKLPRRWRQSRNRYSRPRETSIGACLATLQAWHRGSRLLIHAAESPCEGG